ARAWLAAPVQLDADPMAELAVVAAVDAPATDVDHADVALVLYDCGTALTELGRVDDLEGALAVHLLGGEVLPRPGHAARTSLSLLFGYFAGEMRIDELVLTAPTAARGPVLARFTTGHQTIFEGGLARQESI